MKREKIDEVLNKTLQKLLDQGADRETLELACAGAMINLKSDFYRKKPLFSERGSRSGKAA